MRLAGPLRRGGDPTDLAFLATIKGRVMCETLALGYWAGKALPVDSRRATDQRRA